MASLSQEILNKINPTRNQEKPAAPNAAPAPAAAPAAEPTPAAPTQPVMTQQRANTVVIRPDDPAPAAPATPAQGGPVDLQGLLARLDADAPQEPAPAAPQQPAPPAVPDSTTPAADTTAPVEPLPFTMPDATAFVAPAAAPVAPAVAPADNSAMIALQAQVDTMTRTISEQEQAAAQAAGRQERERALEASIQTQFGGVVPDNVLTEFGDLLTAARNQVGSELGLQYGRQVLDLQDQIAALGAQLAAAPAAAPAIDAGNTAPSNEDKARQDRDLMQTYQQNLAATVPFYSDVMRHGNLQQMLEMPVSPLDPNRTWDMALGEMLANRDTDNISRFVNEFHGAYIKTDKRKSRAVPASNSTGHGAETRPANPDGNTLNAEDLTQLYKASMSGSIKLTDEQRLKLRKAFATATKST